MSVLGKKLHVMRTAGPDEAISLYTTTGECAEPNLKLQVDGTTAYAKLGEVSESNATSLRVYRNSDSKTYAVLKEATTALATFIMVPETHVGEDCTSVGYGETDGIVDYGTITPDSFTYKGTTSRIVTIYSVISGTNVNTMGFGFEYAMDFTKMELDINGGKYTATSMSGLFSGWFFFIKPYLEFIPGNTYTIRILSVS